MEVKVELFLPVPTQEIGVEILEKIKADFAYNYKVSKPKDNPNGKEVKENVAMLTVKVQY